MTGEYEIEISYTDEALFQSGMREIRRQMAYIQAQIHEAEMHHDRLDKLYSDAVRYYCDPDSDIQSSKIWIPRHLAKMG